MSDLTKKILLGLGIGAAVATPIAITYYLLQDEHTIDDLRQRRQKGARPREEKIVQTFVTIRSDAVGAVIGRGGEVVRRIQDETSTRIDFSEDKGKKGDKVATIRGSANAVMDAEAYIHRIIASKPTSYSETFYIPHESVGRVIGNRGDVIHGIADSTNTRIDVARNPPNDAPGNPVTITGSLENIKKARKKIDDIVSLETGRKSRNSFNKSRSNSFKVQQKTYSPKMNGKKAETEELIPTQDGHLQVYVSTAKSPSKFWLQIFGTKSNELDKLTEEMTDFYEIEANFKENKVTDVNVGDIIAAPFNMDESWYRVRVVGIEDNNLIRVYYLDFGDECTHPKESLCSIKPDYIRSLPFQAVECSLAGISPINGDWSDEASKSFCDLAHAGNWIELKAYPIDRVGSVISVDLIDFRDQSFPINIAEELVARGFATKQMQINEQYIRSKIIDSTITE